VKAIFQLLPQIAMELSAVQFRVLAQESRELLIDKLMAATPQRPGTVTVQRPPRISKSRIPTTERRAFRHRPLSQPYVQKKAREALDGRKLIATGDYIEGIEVRKATLPDVGVVYGVGLESRNHEPSGLPLVALARILERGSAAARIPPRPHWKPVHRAMRARLRTVADNVMAEAMRRALREVR
jgi:hypothetical protein